MDLYTVLSDKKLNDDQINEIRSCYIVLDNRKDPDIEKKINILLRCNKEGNYIYTSQQMHTIRSWLESKDTFNSDIIEFCINPLLLPGQMRALYNGFYNYREHMSIDKIKPFMIFKNGTLIYDEGRFYQILVGIGQEIQLELIEKYAKYNKDLQPVFSTDEMRGIRVGIVSNVPEKQTDVADILSLTDNKDKPMLSLENITDMRRYLLTTDKAQDRQVKEFVKEGLSHEVISLIRGNIPADNMRIYKSIIIAKHPIETFNQIRNLKPNYNELKNLKYFLDCVKLVGVEPVYDLPNFSNKGKIEFMIESMRNDIASYAIIGGTKNHGKATKIIDMCLDYRIPPDQLNFIINSGFTAEEMGNISIALISGASFEKIKENHYLAKQILDDDIVLKEIKEKFDALELGEER